MWSILGSWISKIDPNIIVPVFVTGLGWVWNKLSGEKKKDQRSVVQSVIDNFIHELVDRYSLDSGDVTEYLKRARKYIDERVWVVLTKRGVPKNKLTVSLVNEALERGTAELGREVREIRKAAGRNPAG